MFVWSRELSCRKETLMQKRKIAGVALLDRVDGVRAGASLEGLSRTVLRYRSRKEGRMCGYRVTWVGRCGEGGWNFSVCLCFLVEFGTKIISPK